MPKYKLYYSDKEYNEKDNILFVNFYTDEHLNIIQNYLNKTILYDCKQLFFSNLDKIRQISRMKIKNFNQLITENKIGQEKIKNKLLNDPAILNGILRKLMSKDEIIAANQLVKDEILIKGISDDKQKNVMYYLK